MKKDLTTFTPSFCFIAPTEYLDEFAGESNTHLVLAHLVDTDEAYSQYYKEASKDGDYIILDNSAYELKEPFSPEKLIALGKQCGADAIVLPDYPFQKSSKTVAAADEFVPMFKKAGFGSMFVPQSERGDVDDWIRAYKWAAENDDIDIIGMSILGIPNAIPWCDPAYARVVMTHLLMERKVFNDEKHHHYLGLNAGPALEIPSLIKMGALSTIDSSGPIWSAILGQEYSVNSDSFLSTKKPKMPVQFGIKRTKDAATLKRIQHNIDLTLSLFDDGDQDSVWYAQE